MAISLAVKIWGDSTPLLTELEKVKKHLNQVSKELTKMGSELSMALTLPIVAFGALAVKNFGEAEKASVSLAAAIRANGKDVESTMSGYDAFAAKMQQLTTHEDDAVKGFLQLAESMQAPDVKKATQDAIGLNAAYGIEMTAAIKMATAAQLGNYMMLGKAVPAIKVLKDTTQKAALANKIFADGFTLATAQAKSGLGPLEQMKNDLNNVTESFGKIILEGITPLIKHLKSFAQWLDSLDASTKKWIVGTLAVVAAVGPLLLILGKIPAVLSAIINGLTLMVVAFKAVGAVLIANPWVLLATAIIAAGAALGYFLAQSANAAAAAKEEKSLASQMQRIRDKEKQQIQEYVASDVEGRKKIIAGLQNERNEYIKLWNERKKANDTVGMKHYQTQIGYINPLIADMTKAAIDANKNPLKVIDPEDGKKQKNALEKLGEEIGKLKDRYINEVAAKSVNAEATGKLLAERVKEESNLKRLITNEDEYIKGLIAEATAVKMLGAVHKDSQGNVQPGMVFTPGAASINPQKNEIGQNLKNAITPVETLGSAIDKIKASLDGMAGSLSPLGESFRNVFSNIATVVQDVASGFVDGWKDAVQHVGSLVMSVVGAIGEILSTNFSNREKEMSDYYSNEKDAIDNSTMNEKDKSAALTKINKEEQKESKKLLREKAKDQKEVALIQAAIAMALGVVSSLAYGGPVGIALAVIVGLLGAVEIAAIASQPLPSLAEGGLAFAPTLAMVGDNPNAATDPEVIGPLSKIKQLIGGQQDITLHGVLRGSDIHLSNERESREQNRVYGR